MNLKKLLFAAIIVLSANVSFAQDTHEASHTVNISIPNLALLDLEVASGTTTIDLEGSVVGSEAGLPMSFEDANDESIWINYTSIVSKTATTTRNVTVALSGDGDDIPTGLKLTVKAGVHAGAEGAGDLGTPVANPIEITSNPTKIIETIGSAYTGNTAGRGHQLTYQLGYADSYDFKDFDSDASAALIITYTLSDI